MNNFFSLLSKHPTVMLRLLFALVFIGCGIAIMYVPSITNGIDSQTRMIFGALMLIYGGYRFLTFWWEFQKAKKGEQI